MLAESRLTPTEAARLIAATWGLVVAPRTVRRWMTTGQLRDSLTDPQHPTTSLEQLRAVFSQTTAGMLADSDNV